MCKFLKYIIALLGFIALANLVYIFFICITQTCIRPFSILDNSTNAIKNFSSLFSNTSTLQTDQPTTGSFTTTIDQITNVKENNDNVNIITKSESANPYSGHFEKNNMQINTNNLTTGGIVDTETTKASKIFAVLTTTTYSSLNKKVPDNIIVKVQGDGIKNKKTTKKAKKTTTDTKSFGFNSVKINNKIGTKKTTNMPKIVLQTPHNEYKYNLKSKTFFPCDFKNKNINNLPTLYAHLVGNKFYDNHLVYYFDKYFNHDKVIYLEDNHIQHRINQIQFEINDNANIFYNKYAALVINEVGEVSYIDYGDQNKEKEISIIYDFICDAYPERCIKELYLILRIIHYFPQLIFFDVYQKHLDDCKADDNSIINHRAPTVLLMLETQKYIVAQNYIIKQNKNKH
ncbi:hypothetical protein COBT_000485 [Conglomerata obtusa]